jgi:hypothetical protein
MDAMEVRRVFKNGKFFAKTLIEKLDKKTVNVEGDFLSKGMYFTNRDGIIQLMRGKIRYLSRKDPFAKYQLK